MRRKFRTCQQAFSRCRSIYDKSNWLIRYSYSYLWPINVKVAKRTSQLKSADFDNYAPCSCLGRQAGTELVLAWQKERNRHSSKLVVDNSSSGQQQQHRITTQVGGGGGPSLVMTVLRTHVYEFSLMLALILLTDCVCEPMSFHLSVRLIEIIGQFPGGRFSTATTSAPSASLNETATPSTSPTPLTNGQVDFDELKASLYVNAILFGLFISLSQILNHPFSWISSKFALKLRVSLSEMIYRKTLTIDRTGSTGLGINYKQAISLISRDVEYLEKHLCQLPWVLTAVMQTIIYTLLLTQRLDLVTAFMALGISSLVALHRSVTNARTVRYANQASRQADKRVGLISETLEAVKIIRMYAWTRPFEAKIEQTRRDELEQRKVLIKTNCLDAAIFFISCSGAAIATLILAHYVRGLPLTQGLVSQVFLVSTLYRRSLSRYIPQGIISWVQTMVVLNRCSAYMCAADHDDHQHQLKQCTTKLGAKTSGSPTSSSSIIDVLSGTLLVAPSPQVNGNSGSAPNGAGAVATRPNQPAPTTTKPEPIVDLKQVSFEWPDDSCFDSERNLKNRKSSKLPTTEAPSGKRASPCLQTVNMTIGQGELVLVSGKVGCGKSTLLQLILGELAPTQGSISFCPPEALLNGRSRALGAASHRQQQRPVSMAYAPQKAWIFSGTVRDNILFGESFNLTRYYEVLRVCSLLVDLISFADFDRTQIGERGVTLSEGQKARVSLARALYQQADLYLLDDPLSAVDSHVGRHIFNQALMGFLGNKSVLLATHQVQYLPQADRVLYLQHQSATIVGKLPTQEGPSQGVGGSVGHFGTYAELDKLGIFDELKLSTGSIGSVVADDNSGPIIDDHLDVSGSSSELAVDKDYAIGRILSNRLDESGQMGSTAGPVKLNAMSQRDELRELQETTSGNKRARDATTVFKAFAFYLTSAGSRLDWLVFVFCSIACRMLFIGLNIWLNYWASFQLDASATTEVANLNSTNSVGSVNSNSGSFTASLSTSQAVYVSLIMWLALILVASLRSYRFYALIMSASAVVHRKLIASLLWTNLAFFDRTPHGHVLNRVSSDVSHMDTTYRELLEDLSLSGLSLFFIFITIVASAPSTAIVVVLMFGTNYLMFRHLTDLIGAIKHLEGFRRSGLYSHVATTLDGLAIIRAANKRDMFWDKFISLLDKNTSVRFISLSVNRLIIGTLNWILVLFYLILITIDVRDTLNGYGMYAFVGLNLIIQLSRLGQMAFIRFIEFYMSIQSIDRIRKYSNLSNEQNELMLQYYQSASNDLEDLIKMQRAQSTGPPNDNRLAATIAGSSTMFKLNEANIVRGSIEFVGVSLKYLNTNKIVLDNLSFKIGAGEKVGIIGRTGAGKSSLITVLFHLYHFEGFVYIDGQDTKELSLDSLRSSISIIPQEPTLFSGTLRYNLDPLEQHQDADLWRALKVVQLDRHISLTSDCKGQPEESGQTNGGGSNLTTKTVEAPLPAPSMPLPSPSPANSLLDIMVGESGNNFSTGQRQLICLARAILRRNKLLILDEATANVDQETDLLVQQALRSEFKHCTVLTIAHRLNTIVDSDRIMVMDKGRVCEFGKPSELLKRPNGPLAKLIESTGRQQAASLRAKILQANKEEVDSG